MEMAAAWAWVLVITGTLTMFVSYWLATQSLLPGFVQRSSAWYGKPVRITLAGLVVAVPLFSLGVFVSQRPSAGPALKILGGLLIILPMVIGVVGSSGLCQRIGTGLPSPADEKQPWRRVLRGGIALALTFVFPIVGWFIMVPWTLISGFGAALFSLWPGRTGTQRAISV
jgi:hypothetical protein